MNENINLTKILKDCPKGTKLYSTIFGEVEFIKCDLLYQIVVAKEDKYYYFTSKGTFIFGRIEYNLGACALFPSKDQMDWSKFTASWMPKTSWIPKFTWLKRINKKWTKENCEAEARKYKTMIEFINGNSSAYKAARKHGWLEDYTFFEHRHKKDRFDPKTLKPFDKVLARDSWCSCAWRCTFYSHTRETTTILKYVTGNSVYEYCIPYNDETKHLVGTNEEAPEYYRYWED